MSFISREIIGKIWESWHTFFAGMQMFLYVTDHMWTGSSSSLRAKWRFITKASMIPEWQLKVDCFPTLPAKANRHYVQLHQWNHSTRRRPHFHTVSDSRLKHLYNAISFVYDLFSTSNCIYCTCYPSQNPSFFSTDIWEALSVSSMQRVE